MGITVSGRAIAGPSQPEEQAKEQVGPADLERTFRHVVSRFASGVTVVTTSYNGELRGITVSAFSLVSFKPPLILVCIDRLAYSHELIQASQAFAVSIFSDRHEFLSERFAARAPLVNETFEGVPYRVAVTGAPIIEGCLGWLDCRLWASYDGGDHTIFVGEVVDAGLGEDRDPLLYFRRQYRYLKPKWNPDPPGL